MELPMGLRRARADYLTYQALEIPRFEIFPENKLLERP